MFYFISFLAIIVILVFLVETRKPKHYPPGPQWLPLIGSALHISQLRSKCGMLCKAIDELHKIYLNPNGLFGLKFGADMLVVAYSAAAIKELGTNEDLDGRPNTVFYRTRTFGKKIGILTVDGDLWQEHRRFIMKHLKTFGFAGRGMLNIIEHEAEMIVKELKDEMLKCGKKQIVVDMKEFFHVFVLNNIWKMMTGVRYDRNSEEVNEILMMFTKLLQDVDMVGTLFSHFPFLRFIAPGLSGYDQFVEDHSRFYSFLKKEVQRHRDSFVPLEEPTDLLGSYLQEIYKNEKNENTTFFEEQLLAVCLDLFLAGSETTNKSLGFAFLHMTLKPEIQDKAYKELTSVLGTVKYPSWEDKSNLPYCDAIVHEGLRFFMGHTFGVPHRALEDTRLCGYNIPKNTMVVGCFRGMLMDPITYPNPESFNPDRYLIKNSCIIPEDFYPFGIGRHRCMGELLGKQNLFIFISTLLQNFKFIPAPNEPLPEIEPYDGVTAGVKPYKSLIILRE